MVHRHGDVHLSTTHKSLKVLNANIISETGNMNIMLDNRCVYFECKKKTKINIEQNLEKMAKNDVIKS
jgi:hypothetical protein